jgi:hypothetical protein
MATAQTDNPTDAAADPDSTAPPTEADLDAQVQAVLEGAGITDAPAGEGTDTLGGAGDATPDDAPPEPAADDTPDTTADDADGDTEPDTTAETPDEMAFGRQFDQAYGLDLAGGCTSTAEYLARLGAFVQEARQPPAEPAAQKPDETPTEVGGVPVIPEFDESWVTQREDGTLVAAAGAPADAVQRYHTRARVQREVLNRVLADYGKDRQRIEALEKQLETSTQERADQQRQHQEATRFQEWQGQHAHLLFANGQSGDLSEIGKQVVAKIQAGGYVDQATGQYHGGAAFAHDAALGHVLAARAARKPQSKKKPHASAMRQPSAKTAPQMGFEEAALKALDKVTHETSENDLVELLERIAKNSTD